MATTTNQKLRVILQGMTFNEKMNALEQLRAELAAEEGVHESKMTNGTQGERVACEKLGLKWNSTTVHGADAWNTQGQAVELKCFKANATRANVKYELPKRVAKDTDEQHADRVRDHFLKLAPGGHYWVKLSHGSTRYVTHWYIPGASFAAAMRAWALKHPNHTIVNLGGVYCKTCKQPHRLGEIAKRLNNTVRPIEHTFPEKVEGQCK
jgi:hypothetical protein